MCVHATKTANRFEISSLLEKILLKQVRWCLTFVGLYIFYQRSKPNFRATVHVPLAIQIKGWCESDVDSEDLLEYIQ